ncbi:uncharacterized protein N7483_012370 [Penicillium malachiteum]|uniref:uncharacterized protein n=1 Tax=Penicillium malachiteum TaxID=1324776 RepID=UPI002546FB19|nr:uncharacterized protein N7483_012370 [Penicillium malachiteum]KAJ5715189.1 hypothetical protein N7483_012370 [Penicillium malachiteum]
MKLHSSKSFTINIASFCAEMILKDSDTERLHSKDDIVEELKSDYKVGSVYDSYAQKGGSGIIFYLFVLPSNLYEKLLNKSEDVVTVLSHYESTGFQQEHSTKSAAASIMDVITNRFNLQVSIFKADYSVPRQLITPTRERGYCTELANEPPLKKAKARQPDISRSTNLPQLGEEGPDNTVGRNVYSTNELNSGCSKTPSTHHDMLHHSTYQLPQSFTIGAGVSVPCAETTLENIPQQLVQEQQSLPINTDSHPFNGQQTGSSLIRMQHDPIQFPLDSMGSPNATHEETLSYSIPSFNAISEIPSLPHSGFLTSQEASPLPSTSLGYCIPSFSQITGIPSPE